MYDSRLRKAVARLARSMDCCTDEVLQGKDLKIVAKDALFEVELAKHVLMQFIRDEEENLAKGAVLGREVNYAIPPEA